MENEPTKTPIQLIHDYFVGIKYPPIKEIKPCLMNEHGDVYLVSFEQGITESECTRQEVIPPGDPYPISEGARRATKPTDLPVSIPNCYAIVKDGKVAGYHEKFWEDADAYRLVLKQHLGLLVMEAKAEEATPPRDYTQDPIKQEPRDGYSKNETVDAIVGRYEEMLFKAENETAHTVQEAMTREAELTKQLIDAQAELIAAKAKLETIQQVLTGKSDGTVETQPPSPESCMIEQGALEPYSDDEGATLVGGSYGLMGPAAAYPVAESYVHNGDLPHGGAVRVCNNGHVDKETRKRIYGPFPMAINS